MPTEEENEYLESHQEQIAEIENELETKKNRIVRDAILDIYQKIAKLITNALFTLGIDSCAYIIYQFPKNIRQNVFELIKKEVEEYQKLADNLEIKKGGYFVNSESQSDNTNSEQNDKIMSIVNAEMAKINKDELRKIKTYFASNNNWDFSFKFIRIGLIFLLFNFVKAENSFMNHVYAHGALDLTLYISQQFYFWNYTSKKKRRSSSKNPLWYDKQSPHAFNFTNFPQKNAPSARGPGVVHPPRPVSHGPSSHSSHGPRVVQRPVSHGPRVVHVQRPVHRTRVVHATIPSTHKRKIFHNVNAFNGTPRNAARKHRSTRKIRDASSSS